MVASRCRRDAARLLGLALLSAPALRAQTVARAEIGTLLETDDLLSKTELEPPFWETLGSLRTGRDNRARLALMLRENGFLRGVSSRANLRVDVGLSALGQGGATPLSDASSSLGLGVTLARDWRLSLDGYPFDTDYVRLGYLHALDWGGTHAARRESIFLAPKSGAPGFVLAASRARLRLFAGVKWLPNAAELASAERLWGGFGGVSVDVTSALRVDSSFGFFERTAGSVEGASARLVWHRGANEPELAVEPFRAPSLREDPERLEADAPRGAALALEGVVLALRSEQRRTLAPAIALYGSVREGAWAGHVAATWRSLPFVFRNDARFSADDDGLQQAELSAWLGGSYALRAVDLVPSFEVGIRLPGALITASGVEGLPQTWVAGGAAGLEALPLGAARLPKLAARLGLRWQVSSSLTLSLACDYQRDANRSRLDTSGSTPLRVFAAADALALVGGVRARF